MGRIVIDEWVVVYASVECAVVVGAFRTQVVHLVYDSLAIISVESTMYILL